MTKWKSFLGVALVAALVLGGTIFSACGVSGGSYYVRYGPPAPRYYGPVGYAPARGYVWTDGYWDWRGNNWYWTSGRWVRPPRMGARWVTPRWYQSSRGWRMQRGYWR